LFLQNLSSSEAELKKAGNLMAPFTRKSAFKTGDCFAMMEATDIIWQQAETVLNSARELRSGSMYIPG